MKFKSSVFLISVQSTLKSKRRLRISISNMVSSAGIQSKSTLASHSVQSLRKACRITWRRLADWSNDSHVRLKSLQTPGAMSFDTARVDGAVKWDRKSWFEAYLDAEEVPGGYWITDIEGTIPFELNGTYFRNGPGRIPPEADHSVHPYDTDGLVVSIAIKNGRAFFRSRFVTTQEHLMEVDAGKQIFKGAFGTVPTPAVTRPFQIHARNAANTNVLLWKNHLWALYECSQPYKLDPYTLKTLGIVKEEEWIKQGELFDSGLGKQANTFLSALLKAFNSYGILNGLGGSGVTVHPKFDPIRKTTIAHTYTLKVSPATGVLKTSLQIYEFDRNFRITNRTAYTLPNFIFLHDMAFTENYYVIFENPVSFDLWSYLSGQESAVGSVKWTDLAPSKIHLVRRPTGVESGEPCTLEQAESSILKMPPSFIFHIANAFEQHGSVVVDAIHYKRLPSLSIKPDFEHAFAQIQPEKQPISRLKRLVCQPGSTAEMVAYEVSLRAMEFPTVNPNYSGVPHRFVYSLTALHSYRNAPPQAIAKTEIVTGLTSLWSPGLHYFAGEPLFIPKPNEGVRFLNEDDGWLLSLCYNGETKRSEIVILETQRIEEGPICVLKLQHHLPHGLHGTWTHDYFGP